MMRKIFMSALSAGAVALAAGPAAAATVAVFAGGLSGAQEVPSKATAGSGSYVASLSCLVGMTQCTFSYEVQFKDLTTAVAPPGAHIHNAPAGSNGPIVHDLDDSSQYLGLTSGTIVGEWRYDDAVKPLTDGLVAALLAGNTYFNLHTTTYPSGEIRGQITVVPLPGAAMLFTPALAALAWTARRRR